MTGFIAALPMYDWPEREAEVDAEWETLRFGFREAGLAAPDRLVRRNAGMPSVPGGIRDADGRVLAPDPASLAPDELDLHTLWLHPALLFAQTCWGPLELGLAGHVQLVGEADYSAVEGGQGEFYSSAVVMRADEQAPSADRPAPPDGRALLPLKLMRGKRFAFNSSDSMSGMIALHRDLERIGESLDIFSLRVASGGHRGSIRAVAEGTADVASIDCLSWTLAKRHEPAARQLRVVGWTARRKGLPYITSRFASPDQVETLRRALDLHVSAKRQLTSAVRAS